MRLTIDNKAKLDVFVAIFQLLKNWSTNINIHFQDTKLYIQSMDKSHICLANIEISKEWFTEYQQDSNTKISVDSSHLATILNYALKHDKIEFKFEDEAEPDKLYINFLNKETNGSFDHFFEVPLIDFDEESLEIPDVVYDVEFSSNAKKISDLFSELLVFGSGLNIVCDENTLEFNSEGDSGKLKVNVPIEYSISEGEKINVSYSLSHLSKMCTSTKLSSNISISISSEYPMALKYDLGDDSNVIFYIAPKVTD
jgi:proliferating cell nuclear antigen PCNA